MPTLLTIPREIRDIILSLIISTPLPVPTAPYDASLRTELNDLKSRSWSDKTRVRYLKTGSRLNYLPTLLVNHQLRTETQQLIKLSPSRHKYVLDLLLINDAELWPTWLSVPCPGRSVDEVFVCFRTAGFTETYNERRFSLFASGDGGPPEFEWCIFDLLERFLKYGAVGLRVRSTQDKRIRLRKLVLDIQTPEASVMLEMPDARPARKSRFIRPKFVADMIWSDLDFLLSMTQHSADFGKIIHERVGVIKLCVDGVSVSAFDVTAYFERIRWPGKIEMRWSYTQDMWIEWKMKTVERRRRLGFPVSEGYVEEIKLSVDEAGTV